MNVFKKVFFLLAFLAVCLAVTCVRCEATEQPKEVTIRWLYPPEYYQGTDFSEGLAWAKERQDGPWSLLDDKGHILKRGFAAKHIFEYEAGFAKFTFSEDWETDNMIDRSGKVVNMVGAYQPRDGSGLFAKRGKNGLDGFVDIKGKWIIPPRYEDTRWFKEGLCAVRKGGKWGFIDTAGRTAIEFKFSDVASSGFSNGVCRIRMYEKSDRSDKKYGVIDKNGEWVIEPIYGSIFLSDRAQGNLIGAVKDLKNNKGNKDDLVGFLDRKGNWAISPRYPHYVPDDWPLNMFEFYDNGVATIVLEGQEIDFKDPKLKVEYGIIDESGRLIAKTGKTPAYFRGRFAVIYSEKGEALLIDKEGKKYILPASVQQPVELTATEDNIFTARSWDEESDKVRVGYFVVNE